MEFMQEVKGYSDREEDQEEEEDIIREDGYSKQQHYPFPSTSLSSPSANYKSQQNQWLGMLHDHRHSPEATTTTESHNSSSGLGLQLHQKDAAVINFPNRKLEDQMELSLGNKDDEANFHGGACSSSGGGGHGTSSTGNNGSNNDPIQKEHMFDKVVTPSDVGKLNRLVIPKQHAEKYFPLDSSGNEKGLLLNFEDRTGKLWRFRYSYWNSSQSYVMTKGWSRFVKEKKLDAGDIVSFQRGAGESFRHRLYIDWRRRPDHAIHDPASALLTPFLLQNQPHLSQYSIRWGGRLYSVPSPAASMPARHQEHLQQMTYNSMYPFYPPNHQHLQHHRLQHQQQYQQYHNYNYNELNSGSGSLYYSRPAAPPSMANHQSLQGQLQEGRNYPMIIDSVPVIAPNHGKSSTNTTNTTSKRLRLFGVNMECASSAEGLKNSAANVTMAANSLPSSSSLPPLHLRAAHEDHSISSSFNNQAGFSEKARTSMFFDLDPPLQYRR